MERQETWRGNDGKNFIEMWKPYINPGGGRML
jgi:hypothetical protein